VISKFSRLHGDVCNWLFLDVFVPERSSLRLQLPIRATQSLVRQFVDQY
jgi:hypothetical protein